MAANSGILSRHDIIYKKKDHFPPWFFLRNEPKSLSSVFLIWLADFVLL